MPTYSYACDACGKSFEREQRISEDPIKKCLLCGKSKAKRQITSANFILKGGGWYSDGYGSGGSKAVKAEKAESKASKPESTKAEPAKADSPAKAEPAKTEAAKPAVAD